ncbi:hypothetical protein C7212DRAFT_327982, partial [Tuber magnatum]
MAWDVVIDKSPWIRGASKEWGRCGRARIQYYTGTIVWFLVSLFSFLFFLLFLYLENIVGVYP